MASSTRTQLRPSPARETSAARILRFRAGERLLHWAIAIPFLVCLGTAAILVAFYNSDPDRPHRALFSSIHRGSGLALVVLPPLVMLVCPRSWRTYWNNLKEGWRWRAADFKWLAMAPLAALSTRFSQPEEGKFNAGEKLNFVWTTMSGLLFGSTGAVVWFGDDIGRWTGLPLHLGAVVPWLLHFCLAAISLPLVGGHVFLATVNPSTRKGLSGMFSGFVDRHWAAHHYRRWFRENFGSALPAAVVSPAIVDLTDDVIELDLVVEETPIPIPQVPRRMAARAPRRMAVVPGPGAASPVAFPSSAQGEDETTLVVALESISR